MARLAHAQVDAALRALAEPNRRRILALVRDLPRAVGDIAEQVGMSQQAVSFHLRVLHSAGLVTEQRQRTRHLYLVRTDGLQVVQEFLDGFWPSHLQALKRAAEAESRAHAAHAQGSRRATEADDNADNARDSRRATQAGETSSG